MAVRDAEPVDLRPIARLRRIVAALKGGHHPAPADRAWFLAAMQRYEAAGLAGAAMSLEDALGLGRQGVHAWWISDARDRRDHLLIELRAKHFAHEGSTAAAGAITSLARRAVSRAGRRPPGDAGSPEAMMAAVLATGQGMPGPRHLRRILAAGHMGPFPKSPCSYGQRHGG